MHSVATLPFRRNDGARPATPTPRRASFTFPDRFRDTKDAHLDVASPISKRAQYANQSFLSMIANVGSNITPEPQVGLEAERIDTDTSSLQDTGSNTSKSVEGLGIPPIQQGNLSPTSRDTSDHPPTRMFHSTLGFTTEHGRKRRSQKHRLARVKEDMSSSQILQPISSMPKVQGEQGPSQGMEGRITFGFGGDGQADRPSSEESTTSSMQSSGTESEGEENILATKIAQVYGFRQVEHIVSDFPCWLVQTVVVQGRLFVTSHHVCFYAFLPRRSGATSKSGFLFKRGPRNPSYHRYWFVLKGNVLSYYKSASSLYFPQGTVDLRATTSAQLEEAADDGSSRGFSITTSRRTLRFKAESVTSAQEWVKKIQRAIFHSHNEGNTVKICLPIRNILEIEENPMFESWNTLKMKVVDNDETFAVDEYFFSLMNYDNDALDLLKSAIANNDTFQAQFGGTKVILSDAELEPARSLQCQIPRPNGSLVDGSADTSARMAKSRVDTTKSSDTQVLSDESFDEVGSSSAGSSDSNGHKISSVSASNILQGSDVFHQSRFEAPGSSRIVQSDEVDDAKSIRDKRPLFHRPQDPRSSQSESKDTTVDSAATIQPSESAFRLDSLMRASGTSFQKATGIAEALRMHSKNVGNILANESKVYFEKVTNMWTGRTMHFNSLEIAANSANVEDSQGKMPESSYGERFRTYFALPENEKLQSTYHGFIVSVVPVYGKLYLSSRKLCFRSLMPGTRTKMILPLRDILNVDKARGFNFVYHGLVIVVSGHEEIFLEFARPEARDDLAVALQKRLSRPHEIDDSRVMDEKDVDELNAAKDEYDAIEQARDRKRTTSDSMFESIAIDEEEEAPPVIFDDMDASIVNFKPPSALRVVCLTIGSRGDVQPYIALCKGLLAEGHRPLIATHAEFEPWIRKHGIDFAPVAGNPAEIMALCVENDTFTVNFFREVASKMRPWFDALLHSSWKACQGADLLIESPSAMAGVHIAQALQIPYFRAFSMMWTRTRAYPHPFVVPKQKLGGNYNYLSYVIVDKFLWQAGAYQINKWRTQTLGLHSTGFERLKLNNVPFLYNFSPSLVARPLDFSPWIHVTGNWFLDESEGWEAPAELEGFMRKARDDGKKLVYVGFGSMVVENRAAMTKTIVDSVLKADVRCIFSKGWSDRLERPYDSAEIMIPPELFVIKSAPHDWLFGKIDAAVHHGGAGTTAASLRAGVPTIVKPFFGDQKFYGARVEDMGVGRCLDKFNTSLFSRALWEVTHNERIIDKARVLGEKIRDEDGVAAAIQAIYRDLEYAKSLIKHQSRAKETNVEVEDDDSVHDWTMVEDDLVQTDEDETGVEER